MLCRKVKMPKEDNINLPLLQNSHRKQCWLSVVALILSFAFWGIFDRAIMNLSEVIGAGLLFGGLYVASWCGRSPIWRILMGLIGASSIGFWWWYSRHQFPEGHSGLLVAISGLVAGFLVAYAVFFRFLRQRHDEYTLHNKSAHPTAGNVSP